MRHTFAFVGLFFLLIVPSHARGQIHVVSDGDVGVGLSNPGAKLHVNGTGWFNNTVTFDGSGTADIDINGTEIKFFRESVGSYISQLGARPLYIRTGTTVGSASTRMSIFADGDVQIEENLDVLGDMCSDNYPCSSDMRMKKDIQPLTGAAEKLGMIRPITFRFKDKENDRRRYGVAADEVEKVFPELVWTQKNGMKAVAYAELVPPLIQAVNEQRDLIIDLHRANKELRDRIAVIENAQVAWSALAAPLQLSSRR